MCDVTETLIEKRAINAEDSAAPHPLEGVSREEQLAQQNKQAGLMPQLNAEVLNNPPKSNTR